MKTLYKLLAILPAVCLFAACEQEIEQNSGNTDYTPDPAKAPSGITTGDVVDNLGTAVVISSSVSGDGGSTLLDNGVIVSSTSGDFTIISKNVIIQPAATPAVGSFQVRIGGLKKSETYYYRAYALNVDGIRYGDVRSFTTLNLIFSPYTSNFAPKTTAVDDWIFDKYTGYDPDGVDLVWLNDDLGTTAVSSYWDGEDLTLVSPLIRVANALDTLGFYFYAGGYGSPKTKFKVYITEDLSDYGTPVRDWEFETIHTRAAIPMAAYFEKSIHVVYVIEAGDLILYRFSIAPTTNAAVLFP